MDPFTKKVTPISSYQCPECNGPTVAVVVANAKRFAPQRVRVAHLPGCKSFSAFKEHFPELIRGRGEAETDRIISTSEIRGY